MISVFMTKSKREKIGRKNKRVNDWIVARLVSFVDEREMIRNGAGIQGSKLCGPAAIARMKQHIGSSLFRKIDAIFLST